MHGLSNIANFNFHIIQYTLNVSKQATLDTLFDSVVSVKLNGTLDTSYTVDEDTITVSNGSENDVIDVMFFCSSKTDAGGLCSMVANPTRESKIQAYYDMI